MSDFDSEDEFWESDEGIEAARALSEAAKRLGEAFRGMQSAIAVIGLTVQDMQFTAVAKEPGSFSALSVDGLLRSVGGNDP